MLGGLRVRFDVDAEGNIPTLFSTCLILAGAWLARVCAQQTAIRGESDSRYWGAMSWVLLFIAADESAMIHELATRPTRALIGTIGPPFRFAWVVPALALTAAVVVAFLGFYRRLPSRTRLRLAIAAIVYVGGAIGMEMVGALYIGSRKIDRDTLYIFIFTIEETLEMCGMILLINALLEYIETRFSECVWRFQAR